MNKVSVYDPIDTGFRQILGLLLHGGLHPETGNVHSQTDPAGTEDTAACCQCLELSVTIQSLVALAAQVSCPPSSFLELTSMQMRTNWVTCDLQPLLIVTQRDVSALGLLFCKGHFPFTSPRHSFAGSRALLKTQQGCRADIYPAAAWGIPLVNWEEYLSYR